MTIELYNAIYWRDWGIEGRPIPRNALQAL